MSNRRHIAFVCSRLDLPGGIERAICNTANALADMGYPVSLVIADKSDESFYSIHPSINKVLIPLEFGITREGNVISRKVNMMRDVNTLMRVVRRVSPGILITTEYPFSIAAISASIHTKIPVYSWEHHHYHEIKRNFFWNQLFRYAYPKLTGIIALNADEKKQFEKVSNNISVIPNYACDTKQISECENQNILTVARLTHVKGIDYLLKAADKIFKSHPDCNWDIVGNGELKKELETSKYFGEQLKVHQPVSSEISSFYKNASVYVMTSRHECFPMTLIEAMSHGLPCVAFDCETGPRHIINHEKNGMLANNKDVDSLVKSINAVLDNKEKRKLMGENAIQSMERFSRDKIMANWEQLLSQ